MYFAPGARAKGAIVEQRIWLDVCVSLDVAVMVIVSALQSAAF